MTRGDPLLSGALGAAVISTSAVLIKAADLPATSAAALRTGYAAPVLALLGIVLARRGRGGGRRRHHAVLAGVLFAVCMILQNLAIALIGAGVATVVCNLQVLVVALGGRWFFGERPSRRLVLALPVALVGVVLVSGVWGGQSFGTNAGLGVLAGLGNSLCYGAFLLVLRRARDDGDGEAVGLLRDTTAVACVVSLAAVAIAGDGGLVPSWPAHGWLLLLALGPQVVGWLLITSALPRLPVTVSGLLLLLQPMIAMVLSMVALGEDPTATQLAGCALLMAAIGFGVLKGGKAPHPDERKNAGAAPLATPAESGLR